MILHFKDKYQGLHNLKFQKLKSYNTNNNNNNKNFVKKKKSLVT